MQARAVTFGLLAAADGPDARDAVAVFSSLPQAAAALPWNWIIRGLTMARHHRFALFFSSRPCVCSTTMVLCSN
jgi:hypothetical protein